MRNISVTGEKLTKDGKLNYIIKKKKNGGQWCNTGWRRPNIVKTRK